MGIADAESDHALEIDGPEGSMVDIYNDKWYFKRVYPSRW